MTNWEASWGHVGGNWDTQDGTKLSQVEPKLINFCTQLEPSWALLGQVGPCWGHVGTRLGQVETKLGQVGLSWVQFGAKLCQVGSMLGPSWSKVGPSWSQVGPSWAKLGPSWEYLGRFEQEVGNHNARLPHMSPKIMKDGPKEPNMALKLGFWKGFGCHVATQNE